VGEVVAGVEIPPTELAAEATRTVRGLTSPLIFHHSRRVYLFGVLHARARGLDPDPEILYLASLFHDVGLTTPYSDTEQRFEIDGADHARRFMVDHGAPARSAEIVWTAIALHTTPAIPDQLGPEVASTARGVLIDAVGAGLASLDPARVGEVLDAHPRGDFKNEFLRAFVDGLAYRPDTTYGTVNADVLEHFVPGYRRTTMVQRVTGSPWPT
jgi:HD superfamily phosphodiesterase